MLKHKAPNQTVIWMVLHGHNK